MNTLETRYVARPTYRQQTQGGTAKALLLVLTAALAALAIGGALTAFDLAAQAQAETALPSTFAEEAYDDASPASNASTPASQWKRGTVPCLYQRDPAWEGTAYAGETIGTSGCGPTCLSMVYVALTGNKDLSPAQMCAFSERGGYVEDGMTRWALLDEGASQLGLSSRIVAASPASLQSELAAGNLIILSMLPGDFTEVGHFIVACGMSADGQLLVRDPNSPERTHRTWSAQLVCDQARSAWSFSLA